MLNDPRKPTCSRNAAPDGAGVRAIPGVRCPHRAAAAIQGGGRGSERAVVGGDDPRRRALHPDRVPEAVDRYLVFKYPPCLWAGCVGTSPGHRLRLGERVRVQGLGCAVRVPGVDGALDFR